MLSCKIAPVNMLRFIYSTLIIYVDCIYMKFIVNLWIRNDVLYMLWPESLFTGCCVLRRTRDCSFQHRSSSVMRYTSILRTNHLGQTWKSVIGKEESALNSKWLLTQKNTVTVTAVRAKTNNGCLLTLLTLTIWEVF